MVHISLPIMKETFKATSKEEPHLPSKRSISAQAHKATAEATLRPRAQQTLWLVTASSAYTDICSFHLPHNQHLSTLAFSRHDQQCHWPLRISRKDQRRAYERNALSEPCAETACHEHCHYLQCSQYFSAQKCTTKHCRACYL